MLDGSASPAVAPLRTGELVELSLDDRRWRDLEASAPGALAFHNAAWAQLLAACYGFRTWGVGLGDGRGGLAAGLPLIETALPFGLRRRWTSLPFTDYCPPLAAADAPPDATAMLLELLDRERRSRGVARLEIRAPVADAPTASVGFRHVLRLEPDADAVRSRFKKKQVQQRLTKAERERSLTVRCAVCKADVAERYYELHASTRQRLGVPVQPRRFFELLWERMLEPGLGWALLAEAEGSPVAGAVFLAHGGTVIYKFGASERRWQHLLPNNLLLWHAIREACARGFGELDFGRTDAWNDGLRRFKLGWGTEEEELRYTALGRPVPADAHSPGRASRALAAVLRRSPTSASRLAGGLLYRYAA